MRAELALSFRAGMNEGYSYHIFPAMGSTLADDISQAGARGKGRLW